MRLLTNLAVLALILFVILGWWYGWYHVKNEPAAEGHRHFDVDINTDKLKDDLGKARDKVDEAVGPRDTRPTGTTPVEKQRDLDR